MNPSTTEAPLYFDRLAGAVGAPHVIFKDGRATVHPGAANEIADVLRVAREAGAGVGVGAAPITIALDRMCNVLHLDETSLLVVVQAGMRAETLETLLRERGLSLGPLSPLSRRRTIGALLAAPRPSEAGPQMGRFVSACLGVAAVLADGLQLQTRVAPRKATGPDLMHALLGARGTLGLITAATLRIERRGETHEEAAWEFPSPIEALSSARALLVRGGRPREMAVSAAATLSIAVDGPRPLAETERELAHRVALENGGRAVPHTPPPLIASPPEERALPLEGIERALKGKSATARVVGWHRGGAAVIDPERAPGPVGAAPPLVAALKRQLDPDGRLPPWPGA